MTGETENREMMTMISRERRTHNLYARSNSKDKVVRHVVYLVIYIFFLLLHLTGMSVQLHFTWQTAESTDELRLLWQ